MPTYHECRLDGNLHCRKPSSNITSYQPLPPTHTTHLFAASTEGCRIALLDNGATQSNVQRHIETTTYPVVNNDTVAVGPATAPKWTRQ